MFPPKSPIYNYQIWFRYWPGADQQQAIIITTDGLVWFRAYVSVDLVNELLLSRGSLTLGVIARG